MVNHNCIVCLKIFTRKNDLERHQKRKNNCTSNNINQNTSSSQIEDNSANINLKSSQIEEKNTQIINIDDDNIVINELRCKHCSKIFSRSDNLKRHISKFCSIKNIQDTLQSIVIKERKETDKKIEELQNTIIDLKSKINNESINISYNNNNNNNFININNNFVLKFGDNIDQSIISTEKLIDILNQGIENTIPRMIKAIHCNSLYPQYHNIYINDKRSKEAIIFDGKQYKTVIADEAIEKLDSNMKVYIANKFRTYENPSINKTQILENTSLENKFKILEDSIEQKKSNRLVKYILYNGREIVKNTRKKVEKKQIKNIV